MAGAEEPDPYAWLEEVESERALSWVKERNAHSEGQLRTGSYRKLHDRLLAIYQSEDRIPYVQKRGDQLYNFWQDKAHPRGIWRRTTLEEYRKPKPTWQTVLDLDAMSAKDGVAWVWHGATCLQPENRRCILSLSPGGSDADVKREFDLVDLKFVEGGFELPEAKSEVGWIGPDRLWVMTDTGEGSLTTSGYPMQARAWDRGTPLSSAPVLFSGERTDVSAGAWTDHTEGFVRHFAYRSPSFFTNLTYISHEGLFRPLDLPPDAGASVHRQWLVVQPKSPWTVGGTTHPAGSALVIELDAFLAGGRAFDVLFTPSARVSLEGLSPTKSGFVLTTLDNVRSRVAVARPDGEGWKVTPMAGLPEMAQISVWAVDAERSDEVWVQSNDFLSPSRLMMGSAAPDAPPPVLIKSLPDQFATKGLEVKQFEATSKDGTKIPYFQVSKKGMKLDGSHPTLLDGYGGFEASSTPGYSAGYGVGWLEKGGVYVLANIRGGGEFGPTWHTSAIRENRHLVYEDFAAVADDLVARKVTSPRRLAAIGGSNGGLLVGNMLTQYPEKFGAIVCQVPLLDMKRYSHLLAGASWMEEYGDPDDPEQWKFMQKSSPYHLARADQSYPPIFFLTSTRDDRVHPAHARKMAAKLLEWKKPVWYWENTVGGHGGATTAEEQATMWALTFRFLWEQLDGKS